ncbi:MAG: hypothetical protein IKI15_09395 [Lachnospiraceae bacterium]|nr:hypothetical protein [Lachnospiraceae bacterium]
MEKEANVEKSKKGSRGFLIAVLAAVVLSVAVIVGIGVLIDRDEKRREEETKNKKIEDLTIKSMDGKVTLTLSQCVYEGDAMRNGESRSGVQYKNAACDSADLFYSKVIADCPYYYGAFQREGVFVPAAETKSMPAGAVLFFKDNRCFAMSFSDTSKVNYEKYYIEFCETVLKVHLADGGNAFLTFPVDSRRQQELYVSGIMTIRYEETIGINRFENLVQFYSGLDETQCFIDEDGATIYVRLFRAGENNTYDVAKLQPSEIGIAISFCTVNEVRAQFADAFGGK